jgi:hypothetical protein
MFQQLLLNFSTRPLSTKTRTKINIPASKAKTSVEKLNL